MTVKQVKFTLVYLCLSASLSSFYFEGDGLAITSLCPALGKKYSVIKPGMCPHILQQPHGKEIPIAVFGGAPYIILNKEKQLTGGVEHQIMDIYAKKFGFTPNFMMVSMAGKFDKQGGMVDMVRNGLSFNLFPNFVLPISLFNRLRKRIVKLG